MDIDLTTIKGLTAEEAAQRLKQHGYNELPTGHKRSIFEIAFKILAEPMFLLLIAGGLLYFILGDATEALILVSFVFVIMGITFYQEHKTEHALDELRRLSSPRALVLRDGKELRIAGRDVVSGDIVIVHEGDYVPADAKLIAASNLAVDESLLTGESVPVNKLVADKANICASTLVVHGYGVAEVYGTALNTEIGKIGKALQTISSEKTALQKMTLRLVRNLAIIGLSFCVLVALIYGYNSGDWLHGILAGITLAMAVLPEEFPVILTTFLALGAWRISRENVLTRRVPAIEALGSASVLCVDKTGTLTINKMQVAKVFAGDEFLDVASLNGAGTKQNLPSKFHGLMEYSMLASQRDPFDPMEKAIKMLGDRYLDGTKHLHKDWKLIHEYPLSKDLFALSHVWQAPEENDDGFIIAAKGAPEAIFDLCHLSSDESDELFKRVRTMASEGLRVLGVAKAGFAEEALPNEQHDFNFEFVGLIGLADPVRTTVPAAIQKCKSAGIRVIMITGDYAETARNIAGKIGLSGDEVITGFELAEMSDHELERRISSVNIFARIVPEQKLRIVNALKARGETVAMTGDGVNDAPALKAAHIGIAMGERGTDVAREASDLVLLKDDFSSIVQSVSLGRRIFDNIRKAMTFTFAVHIPIIGMSLLPVIFKWPLILFPVHIVFLELIIDPACSIVFEAEAGEADLMQRQPRSARDSLFNKQILTASLLQGGVVLVVVLIAFGLGHYFGYAGTTTRAFSFATMVLANLGLIFANRSWSRSVFKNIFTPNPALRWILSGALVFLGLVLYVPFLQNIFHFAALSALDIAICFGLALFSMFGFEAIRFMINRQKHVSC